MRWLVASTGWRRRPSNCLSTIWRTLSRPRSSSDRWRRVAQLESKIELARKTVETNEPQQQLDELKARLDRE